MYVLIFIYIYTYIYIKKIMTDYQKKEWSMHGYLIQNKPADQNI